MERRLAAVLIADIAGYGRLSQADEEWTRARFQADLHEVFEPKIAAIAARVRIPFKVDAGGAVPCMTRVRPSTGSG